MKRPPRGFLLGLAAASGAASVMYQIVWMRRLALIFGRTLSGSAIFGSTPFGSAGLASSATLLAFFGGIAIGALIWGRVADRRPQSTLILFAAVQTATGFYGFASPGIFRGVQALYFAAYPSLGESRGSICGCAVAVQRARLAAAGDPDGRDIALAGALLGPPLGHYLGTGHCLAGGWSLKRAESWAAREQFTGGACWARLEALPRRHTACCPPWG